MLNSKYLRILDKLWGHHTFDEFASATNKQCFSRKLGGICRKAAIVSRTLRECLYIGDTNIQLR